MILLTSDINKLAIELLQQCRKRGLKLATAESCTGGLIAAVLTDIPGSSDVLERGFVTYSNESKTELIGVKASTLADHGAVSRETALEMANGALAHSRANLAVSVTGVAGPGGGTLKKPVGLVHIVVASGGHRVHRECRFGDIGRGAIRQATVETALKMLLATLPA